MTQNILRISLDLNVEGLEFAPSKQVLEHFGHNFGNLAFVYASSQIFPGKHQVIGSARDANGAIDTGKYDLLLFPAANNLNPTSDLGWLVDVMEEVQKPTLIIGLGVQAPLEGANFELPEGTRRFIDLLKKRGLPVGVRGKQTQDFLASHGVENAIVTGCPSNFLNPADNLGALLEPKFARLKDELGGVALNLEYFSVDREKTAKIVEWGSRQGGVTIFQSDQKLISLLRGDAEDPTGAFAQYASKYFLGVEDIPRLKEWFSQHCRLFMHTPSWIDYLRSVSFSTGTRFHGNMLAIQAGTPALVLYHDQRTLEMSQTMGLPHAHWDEINYDNFNELIANIQFDGAAYDANRRMLAGRVVDLCNKVGFPVIDRIKRLAQG